MSLLNTPSIKNATDEVEDIYNEIESIFGFVPNGIQLWSANPKALKSQWKHIKESLNQDQKKQKLHTIIRYLVSAESNCSYCVGFNGGILINMYNITQEELIAISQNPSTAPLENKNKALLLFAMKSIKDANSITKEEIESLKNFGISEIELFDIVHFASHMLVVNTLFKTFNVQQD